MNAHGKVHKYGNNIDTDVIIPARYLNTADHSELAKHCMEDIDTTFVSKVSKGDIMVGGANFGCGSLSLLRLRVSTALSQRALQEYSTGTLST